MSTKNRAKMLWALTLSLMLLAQAKKADTPPTSDNQFLLGGKKRTLSRKGKGGQLTMVDLDIKLNSQRDAAMNNLMYFGKEEAVGDETYARKYQFALRRELGHFLHSQGLTQFRVHFRDDIRDEDLARYLSNPFHVVLPRREQCVPWSQKGEFKIKNDWANREYNRVAWLCEPYDESDFHNHVFSAHGPEGMYQLLLSVDLPISFYLFFIIYVDFAKIKENFKKLNGPEDLKKRFKAYTKEKALNAEQMQVAKEVLLPVWARIKFIMALYR